MLSIPNSVSSYSNLVLPIRRQEAVRQLPSSQRRRGTSRPGLVGCRQLVPTASFTSIRFLNNRLKLPSRFKLNRLPDVDGSQQ